MTLGVGKKFVGVGGGGVKVGVGDEGGEGTGRIRGWEGEGGMERGPKRGAGSGGECRNRQWCHNSS